MELEDFMRQQFNGEDPAERFPFREEYWEQAKALLEAAEQKRPQRKFFWWWFGIGVSLLVSVGIYIGLHLVVSRNASGKDDISSANAVSRVSSEASQTKSGEEPVSTSVRLGPKANTGEKNTGMPSGSFQVFDSSKQNRWQGDNLRKPGDLKSTKTTTSEKADAARPMTLIAPMPREVHRLQTTNKETFFDNLEGMGRTGDTAAVETALAPFGSTALPLLDFVPLPLKARSPGLQEVPTTAPSIADRKGLGIVVGAPVYPDAPTGRQVGAVIGLYAASELKEHWTLSIGIQWRYRPLTTLETISTDRQLRYSFGYTLDEWQRENWAVHYLELPISVQRRWYRRNIEAGFVPGRMLSASDRLVHQRSSLFPEQTKVLESKYRNGNKLEYRPLYIAAFAGGGYTLSRHIELYGRLFYRPDGVRKNRGETTGLKSKIWPELGLRLGL